MVSRASLSSRTSERSPSPSCTRSITWQKHKTKTLMCGSLYKVYLSGSHKLSDNFPPTRELAFQFLLQTESCQTPCVLTNVQLGQKAPLCRAHTSSRRFLSCSRKSLILAPSSVFDSRLLRAMASNLEAMAPNLLATY